MDTTMWAAIVGLVAGAVGYWFTTFWMKPILQYRELRSRVFADLIFYAQVVNAVGLNERMKQLFEERVVANRRASAELSACAQELPGWYLWWLLRKGQSPKDASRHLIGFSNTHEYDAAHKRVTAIRRALGFKAEED
jgi:hypothetical protein